MKYLYVMQLNPVVFESEIKNDWEYRHHFSNSNEEKQILKKQPVLPIAQVKVESGGLFRPKTAMEFYSLVVNGYDLYNPIYKIYVYGYDEETLVVDAGVSPEKACSFARGEKQMGGAMYFSLWEHPQDEGDCTAMEMAEHLYGLSGWTLASEWTKSEKQN